MNNTKWNEIFQSFYEAECSMNMRIEWKTKDVNGYVYGWDGTWSHFGCEPTYYAAIEWLKIKLTDQNRETVLGILKKIHAPGELEKDCVTVYGYRTDVDYIQ